MQGGLTIPKINKKQVFDRVFGGDTPEERERMIAELEEETEDPFITIRLSKVQVKTLSEYLALLPAPYFRAIALYYCSSYSYSRIAAAIGEPRAKGLISYCKDRLNQCMGLQRPHWQAVLALGLQQGPGYLSAAVAEVRRRTAR